MTNEKAIERLKAFRDYLCGGNPIWDVEECKEAFDIAMDSMRKQVAKKPLQACGHATKMFRESVPWMRYCPVCGQRIDWSDEGEEEING